METDRYELWEPIDDLPKSPYFFELHHSAGLLTVLLKEFDSPDKTFEVKFTGVIGYRVIDETGRLKSLNNTTLSTFCKATDSGFLSWIKDESGGIFGDELIHYIICTSDNILDVVGGPPLVGWK